MGDLIEDIRVKKGEPLFTSNMVATIAEHSSPLAKENGPLTGFIHACVRERLSSQQTADMLKSMLHKGAENVLGQSRNAYDAFRLYVNDAKTVTMPTEKYARMTRRNFLAGFTVGAVSGVAGTGMAASTILSPGPMENRDLSWVAAGILSGVIGATAGSVLISRLNENAQYMKVSPDSGLDAYETALRVQWLDQELARAAEKRGVRFSSSVVAGRG